MESTVNIIKLTTEKTELIQELVSLKRQYQQLYLKYENQCRDLENFTTKIARLEDQNSKMKKKIELYEVQCSNDLQVEKENKRLLAQVKQMRRDSNSNFLTPKKNVDHSNHIEKDSEEFEIEKIMKHRGKKGKREFLIRWKNYSPTHDEWIKEDYLHCPTLLKKYLVANKLKK